MNCYNCHFELEIDANANLGRREECPQCARDLRCCKMCNFYDPKAYNECRESSAQRILEKEKANFCDYFQLGQNQSGQSESDKALEMAKSLFKD